MRILVCGGRDFANHVPYSHHFNTIYRSPDDDEQEGQYHFAYKYLHDVVQQFSDEPVIELISGMARGADQVAVDFAYDHTMILHPFKADWKRFGKAAGGIRNQQMIDEGKPDLVIAFPGGIGTADMVRRAKKHNIEVIEVKYDKDNHS